MQRRLNVSKEATSLLPIWLAATKGSCLRSSRPWRRYGLTLKSTSYTPSSACQKRIMSQEIQKPGSSCASPNSKVWIRRCMPRSATMSMNILKCTSPHRRSTSKASCRPIPLTTIRGKSSLGNWKKSLISSAISRVEIRCSALPRRASGSSTSGQENSADPCGCKPLSILRSIARSRSRNSRRD